MGKPNKIINRALERGCSIEDVVIEALERGGTIKAAARELGVWPNSVANYVVQFDLHVEPIVRGRVTRKGEIVRPSYAGTDE